MAAGGNTMGTTDPSLLASPLTTGHACRHQSLSLPPILDGDRMEKEQARANFLPPFRFSHSMKHTDWRSTSPAVCCLSLSPTHQFDSTVFIIVNHS
uniref:Uncharacterized protein n=1 Tax=Oryza barthii TaxID=65489 RepID=A0A0D3GNV2_9ORYZ